MNHSGKNIAILGLGRSGESAARLLVAQGAKVTVFDSGTGESVLQKAATLAGEFAVVTGAAANAVEDHFDLVVLSPGIDANSAFVRQFSARGIPLTGELELAFRFCQVPVIAITGTNGKTTTTELIAAMLNGAQVPTVACGNIGLPFSEVVSRTEPQLAVVTVEVSSFQLETIETFRPKVALWLNLTPDHLDRYPGMEEYRAAKLRVFENQTEDDFAVVNFLDELPPLRARKITFSSCSAQSDFFLASDAIWFRGTFVAALSSFRLRGLHNVENLMAALGVAVVLEVPFSEALPPLQNYVPAPHRCELVANINGVDFINDSKATNLDSLARALTSSSGPVILIAGGKDKGFGFEDLREIVAKKVKKAVLIGEMATRIQEAWSGAVECVPAPTLAEAVRLAHASAVHGDTVLFSPGTSSFDMFRDYADRGNQFRQLVNNLSIQQP